MPTKYTPAIFQPTVRPSWGGILTYITEQEKSKILEAIIKYPDTTDIQSQFWEKTIKPDLDQQYQNFKRICEARGRGAQSYWGEHKLSLSSTQGKHKDNILKDKDKSKCKSQSNIPLVYINNNTCSRPVDNVDNFPKRPENQEKTVQIVEGKFFLDDSIPEYKESTQGMTESEMLKLWQWIMDRYQGRTLPMSKINTMIKNFNKRGKE